VLLINPHVDFRHPEDRALVEQLTDRLREQRAELELADIRSLTAPLGITPAAERDFSGMNLSRKDNPEKVEALALEHYTTDLGERGGVGTRLALIPEQSPFSHQSVAGLGRVEQAVRSALPTRLRQDAEIYFVGTTASVRDLADVMQRDRARIEHL